MKTLPFIIVLIQIFCSSLPAQIPDSLKYRSLIPKDFQLRYQNEDKGILIDVREFLEFRASRLEGAINIPSSGNLGLTADTIQKDCSLFLYCTTGYRSKRVAKYFYDKGFLGLYSLEGGIVAWKKDGLPVDRKRLRKFNKRHPVYDSRLSIPDSRQSAHDKRNSLDFFLLTNDY
jgi:rhodanese-related sulfurtransferase